MRYLFLLLPIMSFAQKKDTTTVFNLGPVYENILQQQEELKKQYEDSEKAKQAFVIGYFSGKGRALTDQDSIVYVTPKAVKIYPRKKKK